MGIASFIIGLIASAGVLIGLIPLLGWMNWVNLGLALLGFIFALVGLFTEKRKGFAIVGLVLAIIVFCIGGIRLALGGGIL